MMNLESDRHQLTERQRALLSSAAIWARFLAIIQISGIILLLILCWKMDYLAAIFSEHLFLTSLQLFPLLFLTLFGFRVWDAKDDDQLEGGFFALKWLFKTYGILLIFTIIGVAVFVISIFSLI